MPCLPRLARQFCRSGMWMHFESLWLSLSNKRFSRRATWSRSIGFAGREEPGDHALLLAQAGDLAVQPAQPRRRAPPPSDRRARRAARGSPAARGRPPGRCEWSRAASGPPHRRGGSRSADRREGAQEADAVVVEQRAPREPAARASTPTAARSPSSASRAGPGAAGSRGCARRRPRAPPATARNQP